MYLTKDISRSILTNIIGTSNIVRACKEKNIKLIYFSTNYVYPGKKGNYSESDPVLPINNYAWSKLGGECAAQMLKNSLILRICMTEKPFLYKFAYTNLRTNFMFHEDLAKVFFKLINKKGIINIFFNKPGIFINWNFHSRCILILFIFRCVNKIRNKFFTNITIIKNSC